MSIDNASGKFGTDFDIRVFDNTNDFVTGGGSSFTYFPATDVISSSVSETANDGSAPNEYSNLLSETVTYSPVSFELGSGTISFSLDLSKEFFVAHVGTEITFDITLVAVDRISGVQNGTADITVELLLRPFDPLVIQNDFLKITRTDLPLGQATAVAKAIDATTTTETQYVNGLLFDVANTTIPAVAVEGSMYGTVGSSDEITKLVTLFLPGQVETAIQYGLNPQVYACEVLGLAFAFGSENGAISFATNFGPSNPSLPATTAGDALFASLAATAIFGAAETANTPTALAGFVSNWKAFYISNGIPGIANPTADQIDLAARGAAWGDAVGVALANDIGPLPGQVTNFLEDAAQDRAVYGASFLSQPAASPFQGQISGASVASQIEVTGIPALFDHLGM